MAERQSKGAPCTCTALDMRPVSRPEALRGIKVTPGQVARALHAVHAAWQDSCGQPSKTHHTVPPLFLTLTLSSERCLAVNTSQPLPWDQLSCPEQAGHNHAL